MDAATRRLVEQRAAFRCEYCRLSQGAAAFFRFHIDHVTASQQARDESIANLALACPHCDFRKGPNLASLDPFSGQLTVLFNPRRDVWEEHFQLIANEVVGLTPAGRATVRLLGMNDEEQVLIRAQTRKRGIE